MCKGKFITFEGGDASGKSTNIEWLAERVREYGIEVLITHEPGGTPLGEKLRELIIHHDMHVETEALMMFAMRREHIDKVIAPALEKGIWVFSDRFIDSSYAYQSAGRGLVFEKVTALEEWTHRQLKPDLTFLFDLPIEIAKERMSSRETTDKFESEEGHFHERVRQAYINRANLSKGRIKVIDANQPLGPIRMQLTAHLVKEKLLQNPTV